MIRIFLACVATLALVIAFAVMLTRGEEFGWKRLWWAVGMTFGTFSAVTAAAFLQSLARLP